MANPVCLSPLKFYDDIAKQSHRKSYAYELISPLVAKLGWLPSFQFVIPTQLFANGVEASEFKIYNAKTDELVYTIPQEYIQGNFNVLTVEGYKILIHLGHTKLTDISEGYYYVMIASQNRVWAYYSDVFCFTNVTKDCIEIEYWNETGNFHLKNGLVVFDNNFKFKLLLRSEIGKPEYSFEEEGTKRLGYNFIESQVSKKIYKFNVIAPEFICDAMRIIRLCDNKVIRCHDDEYEAISFEMEAEWQTQGDLASVTCEFETDNVIVNLGGFIPDRLGGDYNDDYNADFDT